MASLLVDYENVQGFHGLKGVQYLNEKDNLIIFYSASCMKITKEYIELIRESGCLFKIIKLKIPRMSIPASVSLLSGARKPLLR